MAHASPITEFPLPPSTAEPLAEELVAGLRAAHDRLRDVAHAARSYVPAATGVEARITDAWTSLVEIERLACLHGRVSLASAITRILVVDDSADMRYLMTRSLAPLVPHATIDAASDAAAALVLLDHAGAGGGLLVVSDHDMGPGATGVELLGMIAQRHPRSHRVLFTGHPREHFDGVQVDAHALLSKDEKDALRRHLGAP